MADDLTAGLPPAIEPGDIVSLASGGQKMTVGKIEGDMAHVWWETKDGWVASEQFPTAALRKAK